MKTLNRELNICRIYSFKSEKFKKLFSLLKKNYNLKEFKNIKLLSNVNYLKSNSANTGNAYPLLIYVNQHQQVIIGKGVFCIFHRIGEEADIAESNYPGFLSPMLLELNLTGKYFIKNFSSFITDNIMEIHLSNDNYFEYFDSNIFYGSRIQLSLEFEEILDNRQLEIKQVKFQLFDQSVITIRDGNQVEFNKNTTDKEILSFILFLSDLINELE